MAVAGALALPATGWAQETAVEDFDFGGFRNVLPAGQGETVDAMEFGAFQASGSPPETFVDQLPLYNDLVQAAPGLTMGDLDTYFKPAASGSTEPPSSRAHGPASRSIAASTTSQRCSARRGRIRCSAPATRLPRIGCS